MYLYNLTNNFNTDSKPGISENYLDNKSKILNVKYNDLLDIFKEPTFVEKSIFL
jgi:hypothetical protein